MITSIEIREIFQNQYDATIKNSTSKILVSHFGEFSQELVISISNNVEKLLLTKGVEKKLIKRIFSILIEGLQNIRKHGLKDELFRQLGFLIFSEEEHFFNISLANVIDPDDFQKVEKYIECINSYSDEELKKTYLDVLTDEFMSEKGGAGLGFITTRIKSGKPLNHSYYSLNDGNLLFTFQIRLEK